MDRREVQVFSKEWFILHQPKLVWLANTRYGRSLLGFNLDEEITEVYPNGVIAKLEDNKYAFEFRTHNKLAKRLYYNWKPVWQAFHWFDMNVANKIVPLLNLGFDSFGDIFPDAGSGNTSIDGWAGTFGHNVVFTDIQTRAGTQSDGGTGASGALPQVRASTTTDQFQSMYRTFLNFDTSSLGAGATVDTATLSIFVISRSSALGNPNWDITGSNAADNAITNSTYNDIVLTSYGSISLSNGQYNDWALNAAGRSNVDPAGVSKFAFTSEWDANSNFTGTWSSNSTTSVNMRFADTAGTASDPKIAGTFTAGAGRDRLLVIS